MAASPGLQRGVGRVHVAFKTRGTATVLDRLHQAGIAKARLPDAGPGRPCEAVLLNTAGGLTDGDRLDIELEWGQGTHAVVTTQAAEKVYRARTAATEPARVATRLTVRAGAVADFLPQETILFEGCALDRRLEADISADASLLVVETILLGRRAMGESVTRARHVDRWRIRRDGRLVFADGLRVGPDLQPTTSRAALNDARAISSLILLTKDAEARLPAVRTCLDTVHCEAGASAWNGMLAVRLLGADAAALRRDLISLLECLRGPMPRVWMC
jgi:urease accessory protein